MVSSPSAFYTPENSHFNWASFRGAAHSQALSPVNAVHILQIEYKNTAIAGLYSALHLSSLDNIGV
jgi:hypothetical protein